MPESIIVAPFLKWAGGKRWFVKQHSELLPRNYNRYIEPFLGGGSVFFHAQPQAAILGDANADLVGAYQGIRADWEGVYRLLVEHQRLHSDSYYYEVRAASPDDPVERAARFIYLNRTCFNGIYRVNLRGAFNVPRGTKDSVLLESDNFSALSELLQGAELISGDFERLVDMAGAGDFIFADPPYTVRHNFNGFVKYNEKLFSWGDQERLAAALARARGRGAQVVATNANHRSLKELYEGYGFGIETVSRFSSISAKSSSRNQYQEIVIRAI